MKVPSFPTLTLSTVLEEEGKAAPELKPGCRAGATAGASVTTVGAALSGLENWSGAVVLDLV